MDMISIIDNINHKLFTKPHIFFTGIGLCLVVIIGFVDSLIDYRISFSIFYVIPVVLVTWYAGIKIGLLFSILSSLMWLVAAVFSRNHQIPMIIILWNSLVRFGFFLIIASILYYLKSERENARIDFLTNIPNRRRFEELLSTEIQRSARYKHPLTLVYMDVDNFKTVNDRQGHSAGDRLLRNVSSIMSREIRSTDAVARLGGDEFAVLLIETGEHDASKFINKIQYELIFAMESHAVPVTFSIGIVTFYKFTNSVSEMIRIADNCMYHSKKAGKNRISKKVVR